MKIIRGLLLVCWLVGLAMAAATSVGNATAPSVFGKGPLPTKITNLSKGTGTKPPVSAVIVAPQDATTKSYPLIVFQHGFISSVDWYTDMFVLIASHGYIVAAGQMYNFFPVPSFDEEVNRATAFLEWCGTSLETAAKVKTDPSKTIISGHSRGGKVAFELMNTRAKGAHYTLIAVAGVDPDDGGGPGSGPESMITSKPFMFTSPALIAQCMLGSNSTSSCSPKGLNGVQFYNACTGPTLWAKILKAGHTDMLNPAFGLVASAVCTSGGKMEQTRKTMAGEIVSFAGQVLQGKPLSPPTEAPPLAVTYEQK